MQLDLCPHVAYGLGNTHEEDIEESANNRGREVVPGVFGQILDIL